MGYLLHILLALASLALGDLGWSGVAEHPFLVPLLGVAPYALVFAARRAFLAGRFRAGAALERLAVLSPPLLLFAAVLGLGWFETVERWTGRTPGLAGWPNVALLLALLPFVFFELLAIDARGRIVEPRAADRRRARAFQTRLFLSTVLPFAIYLGVASLVSLHEGLRVRVEEIALLNAGFSVLLICAFVRFLPGILRNTWDTAPLERGRLRGMLEEVARRGRFRCRELLVWRTGNQMANAAIVGFTHRSRIVLFSDALLAHLAPRELCAVFAHEIGHARGHHAAIFASFALVFFLGADLLLGSAGSADVGPTLAAFAGVLFLWYLSFGYLSRRFELEADLSGLELLGEAAPLIGALEEVSGAHSHRRSSWRHFSTEERVRFLERAEADPAIGRKLRRKLRLVSRVGLALLLVVGALELRQLVQSLPEDRLVVALRLGEYDVAAERLARTEEDADERLGALVERGVALPPGERTPDALEERARSALLSGDGPRASELLELAILRGRTDLEPVLTEVEGLVAGDPPGDDLPPGWEAPLRRFAHALGDGAQ